MTKVKNRWLIAAAGVGVHISIGSVYAWSVYTKPLMEKFGWAKAEVSFAFGIAIFFLGMSAAFLGHYLEKHGPRKSGLLSAIFFGAGIIGSGFAVKFGLSHLIPAIDPATGVAIIDPVTGLAKEIVDPHYAKITLYLLYLTYGVLGGIGLGMGYITPVSTMVKWFPDRRGLATGLAIMGFGFAAMISAPLINLLITNVGIPNTFIILGSCYFVVIFLASRYLAPPPQGWAPEGYDANATATGKAKKSEDLSYLTANEAVKTTRFWYMWVMLFINITCGIAILSTASPMAQDSVGLSAVAAATMVGFLGLFNGGGRLGWATLSDITGRPNAYTIIFSIQIIAYALLPNIKDPVMFQGVLFLVLTCYGAGFSIIPAYIGDMFGTKQLGAIHGYILTAWAAAGMAGPQFLALMTKTTTDANGVVTTDYHRPLYFFACLFVVALIASLLIRLEIKRLRSQKSAESAIEKVIEEGSFIGE